MEASETIQSTKRHQVVKRHHVVIVGGGFGGLYTAKALAHAPVKLTLVDRRNFHLFQPLLYQVATGALSPANIAAPIRAILRSRPNVEVLLGEVTDLDVQNRKVILRNGVLDYDTLIVATGATHSYFGHPEWEKYALGLKTIEDATAMRAKVLSAFESAERGTDPQKVREWLTFVIVGGGPTGVELAGAIGEIAHYTLKRNFRHIHPEDAQIILVEGTGRVLPLYPPQLSTNAAESLKKMGVTVMTDALVTDIGDGCVSVKRGDKVEVIASHTVLWAAGVQASPLAKLLADATGAAHDRAGRVTVQPDLTLPHHPEIFAIGDMVVFPYQTGKPLPGVAQVAMQQGNYVARVIAARIKGQPLAAPFHYRDLGSMATIGRASAVADLGLIKLHGFLGWAAWLFIHLIRLVEFESRVLVFLQWAWMYVTRNRAARLITHPQMEEVDQ